MEEDKNSAQKKSNNTNNSKTTVNERKMVTRSEASKKATKSANDNNNTKKTKEKNDNNQNKNSTKPTKGEKDDKKEKNLNKQKNENNNKRNTNTSNSAKKESNVSNLSSSNGSSKKEKGQNNIIKIEAKNLSNFTDDNEEEEEEEEYIEIIEEEEEEEEEEKDETVIKSDTNVGASEMEEEEYESDNNDSGPEDDKEVITKILAHKTDSNGEMSFFVHLFRKSYRKCKWLTESELKSINPLQLRYYLKSHKNDKDTQEPFFNPNYLIPEKIISMSKKKDKTYYLVKWTDLDYAECTWEDGDECSSEYPELIEQYTQSREIPLDQLIVPPRPDPQSFRQLTSYPSSRNGLQIRQYQLSGLNFLINAWYNKRNAILADEMGLGKTAQAVMFLNYLDTKEGVHGPFLVVAPLSTIPHWEREIKEWSNLKLITYTGISSHRKCLKKYEMFYPNTTIPMFQILLTTYEYIIRADSLLSPIKWRAIIIDEAQRMKNHQSKLFNSFSTFSGDFKLLMTGTPLQNNIEELWTLLHFLDPSAFDNLQKFQKDFGDINEVENIVELQTILKPMMLRRMKSDVEKSIAPLEEIIIECPMTPYQKAYYKSIYEKNIEYLTRGAHKGNSSSLNNIAMELRKVCNHPFLIQGAENQITIEKKESLNLKENDEPPPNFEFDLLVRTSSKMILLDKLLHKLKQDNHRVLIFSQMTRMLDIIQDYLDLSGYKFCRIDGSIRSEERQESIDKFNAPGSDYFVFLLCTHSGGVGINLTSADTVIIYDSDFNPQNDIQATSRCHRIGQKKEVKMYRFITSKSYERKMFDMASIKLGLDHAVLGGSKKKDKSKFDIEKLLRFGAYYAYEEEDSKSSETFGEEDIESVISRSTRIQHASVMGEGSTFSKAHFELNENDTDVDLTAPDFWKKYIPVVEEDENMDNCSIAERYRKTKERLSLDDLNEKARLSPSPSMPTLSESKNDKKSKSDEIVWTPNKITKLVTAIIRFGWGRWKAIAEVAKLNFDLKQIIVASHVILKWFVETAKDASPIMNSINQQCIDNENNEMQELQNKFIASYKKKFFKIVTSGSNWKLGRLELLYFIDILIKSAKNLPDDIPIPLLNQAKPTEWWTMKDDQLLIYNTWKFGFSNYTHPEFTFSQDIGDNTKKLTNRLHGLMNNLKMIYMTYKMKNKDSSEPERENLTFSCEVLKKALNIWTAKDQKNLTDVLILYGAHPDMAKFKENAKIDGKSDEEVQSYIQKVIEYCKHLENNEPVEPNELVEPISVSRAHRILTRYTFFDDLRTSKVEITDEDGKKLVEYLKENGFSNFSELEWVKEKYKMDEFTPYTVMKLVRRNMRVLKKKENSGQKRLSARYTRSSHSVVDEFGDDRKVYIDAPYLTKNDDGSYNFPVQITPKIRLISVGEVVYDRPFYHTDKYIYPVGYQIEKEFYSIENPNNPAIYRASVLDGGDRPLFKVECLDKSKKVFEGYSPSKPWMEASLAVEASKKKFHLPTKDVVTISGPVAFGFPLPIVTYLIDHLPNAKECKNHIFKRYAIKGEDNDDEIVVNQNVNNANNESNNEDYDYDEDDDDDDDENSNSEEEEEFNDDQSNDENDYNSYDDSQYDYDQYGYDNDDKIRIRMRRIRVSKKRKDFFPNLNIKFTHFDEFKDDIDKDIKKDVKLSVNSQKLINSDFFDFRLSKSENSEDKLKEVIEKLSKDINENV